MSKRILGYCFLAFFVAAVVLFLATSFIACSLDPSTWGSGGRFLFVLLTLVFGPFFGALTGKYLMDLGKEKRVEARHGRD
jgi:hypothetical protein